MPDWAALQAAAAYDKIAAELLSEATDLDLPALGRDPFDVLRSGHL